MGARRVDLTDAAIGSWGRGMKKDVATAIVVHDDIYALRQAIESVSHISHVFVFVSRKPWNGEPGDWRACRDLSAGLSVTLVEGDWLAEDAHRRAAVEYVRAAGFNYCIFLDADEVLDPKTASSLAGIAEYEMADRVYVKYHTYWKGSQFLVRPQEPYEPLLMMSLKRASYVGGREAVGGESLRLGSESHGVHHLGYCGPDSRIEGKLRRWRHHDRYVSDWFVRTWKGWDVDVLRGNLHPTVPHVYARVEMVEPKPSLHELVHAYEDPLDQIPPGISVVIPLYGGREDLARCLASLDRFSDQLHEVIVVDDCSEDDSSEAAQSFDWARVIKTERRLGFSGACNTGLAESSGSAVLFLNSDTVVPQVSLVRLAEALNQDDRVGAAGPYSNHAHELQIVQPAYSEIRFLEEFAVRFAARSARDVPTDMLSGFCLLVKRDVLDEVGGFDEGFGSGTWEDNDLSYRIVRSGRYLIRASKSYVHHSSGSPSLSRTGENRAAVFEKNRARFHEKWLPDLESGFASALPGYSNERIWFKRKSTRKKRPLASAICCTFARPRLLEEAIECFLRQDYEPKEMIILNDHPDQELILAQKHPGIRIINAPERYGSLGEKRNAAMAHAKGEYLFVWDDDDLSLPWRMSSSVKLLEQFPEYDGVRGTTSLYSTHNADYRFFGGIYGQGCFRRSFCEQVRYEEGISCGEDWRFENAAMMLFVDPAPLYWMVCRWGLGIYHISGIGEYDHAFNWEQAGREGKAVGRGLEEIRPQFHEDHWRKVAEFLEANLPGHLRDQRFEAVLEQLSSARPPSGVAGAGVGRPTLQSDTSERT